MTPAPPSSRLRALALFASALLAATAPGCTQPWLHNRSEAHGSSVTYTSASVHSSPQRPTASGRAQPPGPPAPAFRRDAAPVAAVRYEPIRRTTAISTPQPTDATDHDLSPGDADDRPLEDRHDHPAFDFTPNDGPHEPSLYDIHILDNGLALPYPTTHVFRGFGPCRRGRHSHEALDIGGVGPNWGVGTPIRAMAASEVLFIGTGADNPEDFGTPDLRKGEALRGRKMLPRALDIPPYGHVTFFTRQKGRWRSGNVITTRVIDGPLAGHTIRYIHVAAVHPDLHVGSVLTRGQEIALMGGTGVQESAPHLHLDIATPEGKRLDVAPLLGLAPTASCPSTATPPTSMATSGLDLEPDDAGGQPVAVNWPRETSKTPKNARAKDRKTGRSSEGEDDASQAESNDDPNTLKSKANSSNTESRSDRTGAKSKNGPGQHELARASKTAKSSADEAPSEAGDSPKTAKSKEEERKPSSSNNPKPTKAKSGDRESQSGANPETAESKGGDLEPLERPSATPEGKTYLLGELAIENCKDIVFKNDFSSGRFATHRITADVKKGSRLVIELQRSEGKWQPQLTIDADGATLKTLASGKIGKKAVTSLTAKADQKISIVLGAWEDLPRDATYALKLDVPCRR